MFDSGQCWCSSGRDWSNVLQIRVELVKNVCRSGRDCSGFLQNRLFRNSLWECERLVKWVGLVNNSVGVASIGQESGRTVGCLEWVGLVGHSVSTIRVSRVGVRGHKYLWEWAGLVRYF